ncbi:hypothetical protein OY671_008948, partial [Metschnikowia pulcherrima]
VAIGPHHGFAIEREMDQEVIVLQSRLDIDLGAVSEIDESDRAKFHAVDARVDRLRPAAIEAVARKALRQVFVDHPSPHPMQDTESSVSCQEVCAFLLPDRHAACAKWIARARTRLLRLWSDSTIHEKAPDMSDTSDIASPAGASPSATVGSGAQAASAATQAFLARQHG